MTTAAAFEAGIPVPGATPYLTYDHVTLEVPGRLVPLELKVSFPVTAGPHPVILLSHGHGASMFLSSSRGYGPLVEFWASHGFAVIQPTHQDSTILGLREVDQPEGPLYWRSRVNDMTVILDRLDEVEAEVPGLRGGLDRDRVAVAGHSLGGHTVALLLGTTTTDPVSGEAVAVADPRIKTGVMLAPPGNGTDLNEFAARHYPVLGNSDFSTMTSPALVVAGDRDLNPMFSDRVSYRWDAYTDAPGPKDLLTFYGGEHILGGISGWDAAETTDENPGRVAALRALTWAYLRSQLFPGDPAWSEALSALSGLTDPVARASAK